MAEKKKKSKKKGKNSGKLMPKVVKFCLQYAILDNITQAALSAGYSKSSAHVTGYRLLKDDMVKAKVEEFRKEIAERAIMTADEIRAAVAKTAKDDIGNYASWKTEEVEVQNPMTGSKSKVEQVVVKWRDSDQIDTSNIKKISFDKQGRFQIELHDSAAAKKTLGEWAGLGKVKEEKGKEENAELTHLLEEGE